MIEGDSGEYEFLTEAVELSREVPGMCCEIGLRLGLGTKMIIDACAIYRPSTTVISIDPYGSIKYIGREHMGEIRLDYTNDMGKTCMTNMSAYVMDKPVFWQPWKMTSDRYFKICADGVELYELETTLCNKYAMVHLDGVHTVKAISEEVIWFNVRMDSGATIVVDDVTIDFVDIKPIQKLFTELGWNEIKMGNKKGLWQKI